MRNPDRPAAPFFRTVEEKLEHVAAGRGIVLLPVSTAVFYTRPGVAYVNVSDIAPNQVCLAWEAVRSSPLIQDFAAIAADHLPVAEPGRAFPCGQQTPAEIPAQAAGPAAHVTGKTAGQATVARPQARTRRWNHAFVRDDDLDFSERTVVSRGGSSEPR